MLAGTAGRPGAAAGSSSSCLVACLVACRHAGQTRSPSPEDLAAMLAVPIETVYHWRKRRIGPPGFRVGRHVRYDPAAVRDWIERQTAQDAA
ncbi:helix-turn-helix domain-containing protein [Streptomyces sp. NBC_01637]|uniref:helix-turn-helix domain-containing protein n=1 Tax=unclassified Streptomyces TaxID=2593676 RepID=UPI00386FAFAA